jgi:hypothetical protein
MESQNYCTHDTPTIFSMEITKMTTNYYELIRKVPSTTLNMNVTRATDPTRIINETMGKGISIAFLV